MPIFNQEFTFIHIPKCGGTTIENFLVNNGYTMRLYDFTQTVLINGHSPQHSTFRELAHLNILTDKIFTIRRSEKERVISAYFFILTYRPDIKKLFKDFDGFLDLFLNKENALLFDNHNLSNKDFLINKEGIIDPRIKIFDFFDTEKIEAYLGLTGLNNVHELNMREKKSKADLIITTEHIERINAFYRD